MKDKPEPDQMLLDDSWDDLPVIQRQEESPVEEVLDEAKETLPVENPADDVLPSNAEPAGAEDTSPPVTNLKLFQAEETKETAPPVEHFLPIDGPSEQVEEPLSVALAEPTTSETSYAVTEALLDPQEAPPSALKPKITQVEAMRQALNDLGLTAKNAALSEYLHDKFGLLPKNIAVLKSTVKKSFFSQPEPTHQDLPEPEQTATTESIQGVVAPESNGVLQPAEPVLAESETLLPDLAHSQVNAAEEPPPEYLVEAPTELEVGPSQLLFGDLDAESEEPMPALEPITYSMEEVMAVKGLCDRMGIETFLALLDILG